ncbi:MAG: helix-turn-helix domain-containing protein [Candidatus Lokiarchaeota archaeon]|nr:helix-turn-helix domain-containing protein [Candidatus Lokiarchaeota archaeon]
MEAAPRRRQRAYGVRSINLAGSALILASACFDWTKNKTFAQAMADSIPWGGTLLVLAAVANIGLTVLYLLQGNRKILWFVLQAVATSAIIFVFLSVTNFYVDFFNSLDVGYFLCGLGLVLTVLELVSLFIFHPGLEGKAGGGDGAAVGAPASGGATAELEKKFYEALDHEIRRRILRMIGENGVGTFTEFKSALSIGTGTLYHHLNILSPLVFQKDDKKYYLTKLGEMTLRFMQDNLPYLGSVKQRDLEGKSTRNIQRYLAYFDARPMFARLFEGTPRLRAAYLLVPLALYTVGAFLGFQNYLYFFVVHTSPLFAALPQVPAFIIQAVISWFVMWALIESLCYANFKKKADFPTSLAGCGISSIPIFIYEVAIFSMKAASVDVPDVVAGALLVIAQLVTVYFLVMFQMYQKGLKLEKSISVVLPAHYIAIFIYLLVFIAL